MFYKVKHILRNKDLKIQRILKRGLRRYFRSLTYKRAGSFSKVNQVPVKADKLLHCRLTDWHACERFKQFDSRCFGE